MKISLKAKLNISFLAVIIICGLIAAVVGMRLIFKGIINQAQDNVKNDLNIAREIYQQEIEQIKSVVRFTALRFFVRDAIFNNDNTTLRNKLDEIRAAEALDILNLTDSKGQVFLRSRTPSVTGDSLRQNQFISQVLSDGKTVAGVGILSHQELEKEGDDLAKQSYIEVVSIQEVSDGQVKPLNSGICIQAVSAIVDYNDNIIGMLYGGRLINRSFKLVDKIKQTTYQDIKYKQSDIGRSTIFQRDIRISTNVMNEDGQRAIGTQMSEEVYDRVVNKGMSWIERAFVVDKWYITAYEPIKDVSGQIIGSIAVGIQEQKFVDMRNRTAAIFLSLTIIGMILAMVVSNILAEGVLCPIKDLTFASRQWANGNLDYRVEMSQTNEISQLAKAFNQMAFSLQDKDKKLKEYTDYQIIKSERLATLGQLAAGVAHEINNPLGAIVMYSHLSLEDMDDKNTLQKNIEKTVAEASRCRDIIKGLLYFSRQTEPKVETSDINDIIARTLRITRDQELFKNIRIEERHFGPLPKISVDVGQMQQVFTNIVLNAGDAMEGNGTLTVESRMSCDNNFIEVAFTDTGYGIKQENIEKIFEPFFTTKEVGKGTGLGLAVSYGIITRHKGTIEVRSKADDGCTVIVKLPTEQNKEK